MLLKVGNVVEGEITGITNFGAFVKLDKGQTGLVHISEVSHDYVSKIDDYLKVGDKVKVKILSLDNGKISLSIRQARPKKSTKQPGTVDFSHVNDKKQRGMSFEDKISSFMKDSSERQDAIRARSNKRGSVNRPNR